ncbi:SusD-like starch-binding protein associating with outer membrane [Chitinophaga skermanii]|uniref:SusD-like starch-binding protein associating with outer membrane n=1 Tax=Chitinophaga skermanii TaxID=331697 RepID=A0A327Q4E7_9BACT|nr:RagB/SusD family nutrient uptake outer membrane protein [Chitinophaga skermanii]RAI98647.1 SusD-like starch-binding protein associating with outer membrane [Chitinophaga skermanii]
MRLYHKLLFLAAGSLVACNKFLDVKPKGKLIPQEISEFNHLLDNQDIVQYPFLNNNSTSLMGYLSDNIELSEGVGKVYYKANNSANIDNYYAYTFRTPYRNPTLPDYYWNWGTYRSMKYFNNVIDGINNIRTNENAKEADAVTAQAYVGRAWSYFHTVLVYGPMYKPGGDNSTKTIPYVTSSDISAPMVNLSTTQEVFDKVLADLHTALPNIPENTNYPSRPTKAATWAMLAYYHLFTQRYDSVAYYANLSWTNATAKGIDKVMYDFNTLSYADTLNPLSSAILSPDSKINLPNSREILFFRNTDNRGGKANESYPSSEFIGLFDQAKDLRFKYYFMMAPGYKTTYNGVTYNDGTRLQYYRGATAMGNPKFQMTAGFTYPEVLLMRAEAYARLGRLSDAMNDLNLLRRYRFVIGTAPLAQPASPDEVINLVLQERRRELPLAHLKRFMDLKRFSIEPGKPWSKATVKHTLGAETFEGRVDGPLFILPISNTVLLFNPGWGIPPDNRPYN